MNKKKFLAMLLTAAMALSVLAGCGSKETTTPAAPAESGEAEGAPYKIALIQQHQTAGFIHQQRRIGLDGDLGGSR